MTSEDLARELDVGELAQPISGFSNLTGNCAGMDARIQAIVAHAGVNISGFNMNRCLARSIFSNNDWSFPERVRAEVGASVFTNIECVPNILDGAGNPTTLTGQGFPLADGTESLKLATSQLPLWSDAVLVGLVMHEVSHNRSYLHGNNGSLVDYAFSVPQHLLSCGSALHSGINPALPVGPTRYDFATETTLAPVGSSGGAPASRSCVTGSRMAGLALRTGANVDAIGARCRSNPNVAPTLNFSLMGGTGGTAANSDCALGEMLIGVYGNSSDAGPTRIGPICASVADINAGSTGPNTGSSNNPKLMYRTARGTATGYNFERICPQFMVVEELRGRAGAGLDRLDLFCERLDRNELIVETSLAAAGGNGGNAYNDRCAGRSAMVGLTYETDWVLASVGGICAELSRSCSGSTCFEMLRNGQTFALGSHGANVFDASRELNDRCGSNEALVGLNVRSGDLVDAVGGICANISGWTLLSSAAPPTTNLPIRGGAGGSASTRMCARGELLTGWIVRAGSLIDRIQPVCRSFR